MVPFSAVWYNDIQINILDSWIQEIQEAISAGQRAQSTAEQILNSLKVQKIGESGI